jgi:hypothetical protein
LNTQCSGGKPNIDLQYHQFDMLMRESAHFTVQVRKLMTLLDEKCRALIAELNLGQPEDVIGVTPLTGGVASDIAKVNLTNGSICLKFAMSKLKVSENWEAPVHRNAAEYAWLEMASHVHPQSAVRLFGCSATQHGFAMEFISGDDDYLWKTAMLDG